MTLRKNDLLIDDETVHRNIDKLFNPRIDGKRYAHGYTPRDFKQYPKEMFAPPTEIKIIPKSEWSARLKEKEQKKSSLGYNRQYQGDWDALDQNGKGYCWAHSTTSAVMLMRARDNQPYVRLSAYAIACIVKNFRDEGGWCGLSAKFHEEKGCPSVEFWPEKSMAKANDKPGTWENAKKHQVTGDWIDLTRDVYDQNLTFDMIASLLLSNQPCAVDFNWWSHSVCGMELVEVEAGSFGLRILNSWGQSWGDKGTGVLRGSKAIPDGAVCLRVSGASQE